MSAIEKVDFLSMVEKAQTNLNDSYRHYKEALNPLAQEFVEIKLQLSIFQYDMCVEMTTVVRNQAVGFAASNALKGLVLRLFEFDLTLKQKVYPRLQDLAKARGVEIDSEQITRLKKTWRLEQRQLESWGHVRNKAAGHYDKEFRVQVAALEGLDLEKVMGVAVGFLNYVQRLLIILRDTGRGIVADQGPLK